MMTNAATFLTAFVLIEHVYFMILEMFLWTHPRGRRIFGMTEEYAKSTATLAANQGLYNGFLAAGLLWSFLAPVEMAGPLRVFFLSCVIVAGLYGAYSVNRKIFFIQALPAAFALLSQ